MAAELQSIENSISIEIIKTHEDAVSSLQRFSDLSQLSQKANNALSSVMRKYDKGGADIVEVLATQNTVSDAHMGVTQAVVDLRSAKLRLWATAGLVGRKHVDCYLACPN